MSRSIFNATYLAMFLYSMRRIYKKIKPMCLESAIAYVDSLHSRGIDCPLYAISSCGIAYHIGTFRTSDKLGEIAYLIRRLLVCSASDGTWKRIDSTLPDGMPVVKISLSKLISPELYVALPSFIRELNKWIGDEQW